MALTKEQQLHRRAQKAEGAVQSALYHARIWRETFSRRQGEPQFWLAGKVLDDIERALGREALSKAKEADGDQPS